MSARKFTAAQLLSFTTGAFLGGLFCSWLSSPRSGAENRRRLSEGTNDFRDKLRSSGQDLRSKNFPDLYEATEDLGLTEQDLIPGGR